ncbi:hypothetical protein JPM7_0940 [Metamycoplasma equirhinis]|uniref:HinT-interacting membrane complex protein P80 n=1 Tax=Metamycoplasma equirhinis TaxID=92402 RepID=UPI002572605F|nr:hypothetical protein [Metamycoplasma equirhinis]BDX52487.1 hypothetical protein JPM7_0940 [Metamycoplasma equirhinis]
MSKKNAKIETTEQKTKRKKVLWGSFWATTLAATVATGIAVPLVQAKKALPKPTPLLQDTDSIFSFTDPNGKTYKHTWGEIKKQAEKASPGKNIAEGVAKHLTKFLYEKEYEASLWYEAVYNADKAKEDERKLSLPSVDEIKEDETKKINDLEKKYQEQYGLEKKWNEKFLERLASSEYGNAKSKKEAIENKVVSRLNNEAFRRFNTEVNTDFSYSELKNGIIANKDVYYTYKGKKVEVAKKGDKITLEFAKENENYVLPKETDVEIKTNPKDEVKIPMFVSKTFIKELRNPSRYIAPWIKRKQAIVSTFNLAAHPDLKDSKKPWTVTKAEIIKLLKFSAYPQENDKVKLALGIDMLTEFKGLSVLLEKSEITKKEEIEAQNNKAMLEYVSSSAELAGKYGSNGFENITSQIKSKETDVFVPLVSMLLGSSTSAGDKKIFKFEKKDDLFSELKTKLVALFGENEFKDKNGASKKFKEILNKDAEELDKTFDSDLYASYNAAVEKYINDLTDKDFNDPFGLAFRDVFGDSTKNYRVATIIESKQNKILVTPKGIQIKNLFELSSEDVVKRLILNDLAIQSKAKYNSTLLSQLFNLSEIFSDILTKDYMVEDLLKNEEFKTHLKKQEYKTLEDKNKTFDDADIALAAKYEKNLAETLKFSLIQGKASKIKEYVSAQINSGLYSDYKYDSATNKFTLEPHNDKEIVSYLFEVLVDYIKNI